MEKDNEGEYNPESTKVNFKMAMNHGQAKRVYKYVKIDDPETEGRRLCPCCGLPIDGEELPLGTPLKDLYHLGPGYALYFKFLKDCSLMFLLVFLVGGLYGLITNAESGDCPDQD
mmetsp:Transcript_30920/g.28107  ORF Transcript_30920/g.28107 Transcript_30920/m.28107 type:complete len:115 (+) Transcript_30920:228-572(+)